MVSLGHPIYKEIIDEIIRWNELGDRRRVNEFWLRFMEP